jgi:hypothetical protein
MKKLNLVATFFLAVASLNSYAEATKIEVYRSPSCSCCGKWVEHLKENHFQVVDNVVEDVQAVKDKHGVPKEMASCHTAVVNGYAVEGHVPAADIQKLLKLKSPVAGIAVPAMPVGTPGMEMGGRKDKYDVISFDKAKKFQVFTHHEEK